MGLIIENSSKLPYIHARIKQPVQRSEVRLIASQIRESLAKRRKHSCVYIGIDFSSTITQEELPLVPIISQFAHVYHETRADYQLELLVVIAPPLMPCVRYIAESLVVPMLFFASYEALYTYVLRRNMDTQPIPASVVREAATNIITNY